MLQGGPAGVRSSECWRQMSRTINVRQRPKRAAGLPAGGVVGPASIASVSIGAQHKVGRGLAGGRGSPPARASCSNAATRYAQDPISLTGFDVKWESRIVTANVASGRVSGRCSVPPKGAVYDHSHRRTARADEISPEQKFLAAPEDGLEAKCPFREGHRAGLPMSQRKRLSRGESQ
jgi:hypothetical protein